MLLRRGEVNPDKPENEGRTPLSYAAADGKEEVAKMLLGRGEVDPDKLDNEGRTPLSYAAKYRYGEVVKMLLAREEVNVIHLLRAHHRDVAHHGNHWKIKCIF